MIGTTLIETNFYFIQSPMAINAEHDVDSIYEIDAHKGEQEGSHRIEVRLVLSSSSLYLM